MTTDDILHEVETRQRSRQGANVFHHSSVGRIHAVKPEGSDNARLIVTGSSYDWMHTTFAGNAWLDNIPPDDLLLMALRLATVAMRMKEGRITDLDWNGEPTPGDVVGFIFKEGEYE
jgi:hypothetical protein